MKTALLAALTGLLMLGAVPALAQTMGEPAGITCQPVQAPTQTTVQCNAQGLAPGSAVNWSASLPGNQLAEATGTTDGAGNIGFRFVTGATTGAYLVSATGTAADSAPFSAEVAGTVVAAVTPTGPIAAGFGPGSGSTLMVVALLAAALMLVAIAVRPSLVRVRR